MDGYAPLKVTLRPVMHRLVGEGVQMRRERAATALNEMLERLDGTHRRRRGNDVAVNGSRVPSPGNGSALKREGEPFRVVG